MTPGRVYFGAVEIGKSAAKDVSVRVVRPETVRIVSASVDDERFSLQQTGGDSVGNTVYSLTFKGAEKPENVRTWLEILYDAGGDEPKRKRVPILVDVVGQRADKQVDAKVR